MRFNGRSCGINVQDMYINAKDNDDWKNLYLKGSKYSVAQYLNSFGHKVLIKYHLESTKKISEKRYNSLKSDASLIRL